MRILVGILTQLVLWQLLYRELNTDIVILKTLDREYRQNNSVNLEQYATTLEKIKCYKNRGVRYGKEEIFLPESEKTETYRLIFYMVCSQSRYSRDSLWRCHSKLRIELLQSILIAIIGPLSFVLVG